MPAGGTRYPSRVRFEIAEGDLGSYGRAADFLNVNQVDVLSVQHEYGIFGGKAGAHVLALLRELRMPIVTTLHTVLSAPNPAQRAVIEELARLSERLVVMSDSGADLLRRVHGMSERIRSISFLTGFRTCPVDAGSKDRLGVDGKTVILTFGLLSRDKGIEYVIDALPAILAVHPDTVYIVLGATHPHVVEHEGEAYRLMLEARGQQLGVAGSMIFHNRFVSQDELTEFLSATDIYITPYLQPEQITSGTLAYAVGAGKAVISTPYIYARELLADGRGVLVPWRDSAAIAQEVIALVSDRERRRAMCARAAAYGVGMTWPAIGGRYVESFARARTEHTAPPPDRIPGADRSPRDRPGLPEITLKHVRAMTDDTGMLQHAIFSIPRYDDGYCLDDNARALLLMALLEDAGGDDPAVVRTSRLAISRLRQSRLRSSDRALQELPVVRAALAGAVRLGGQPRAGPLGARRRRRTDGRSRSPESGRRSLPRRHSGGDDLHESASLGLHAPRPRRVPSEPSRETARPKRGARSSPIACSACFNGRSRPDWPWFEDSVTYCNGRLSQALIVSGDRMNRPDMVEAGMRSLDWLISVQSSPDRQFAAIGSSGFYSRGAVAGDLRSAAGRSVRDGVGVPRRVPRARRQAVADPARGGRSTGFSARTICSTGSSMRRRVVAATGCTSIGPIKTRAPRPRSRSCSPCTSCGRLRRSTWPASRRWH